MQAGQWRAPPASGPVNATVELPGSKSMTNRALVLAALAEGASTLRRPLRSRDTSLMVDGLRALGARVDDSGADWLVEPLDTSGPSSDRDNNPASSLAGDAARRVDVGNAGTVMRFLPPVAALANGDVGFDGDARARQRPLGPLLDGLRALGADIVDGGRGALPVTVRGRGGVHGGAVSLDASGSSQLVSGLLLPAFRYTSGIQIRHVGEPIPSMPHVTMTVSMLRAAGVAVQAPEPGCWRVSPGTVAGGDIDIEPDLSNAAPFLGAALATGGCVRIPGWPTRTTQPGDALRDLLEGMGASTSADEGGLTVHGAGDIHGVDVDLHDTGELAPTLAAIAALASSPSRLRGIAHLRRHETDRLDALARELGRLGAGVTQTPDGLHIRPRPLHGDVFHTYDDHRIATAGALLGLVVPGVNVEDVTTTEKTLPGFTDLWSRMVGDGQGSMS